MKKKTLRKIFSKHIYLNRKKFELTQIQLADAAGTSLGWIQKIESGKKLPGFFLAVKLAVILEIDMNVFMNDFLDAVGPQVTASKPQESLVLTAAAKDSIETEVTSYVQV